MEAVVNCYNSTQTGVSINNRNIQPPLQTHSPLNERLEWRKKLYQVPLEQLFELEGRPKVVYKVMSFCRADGAQDCRKMVPFLFKSFELGQTPPSRLDRDRGKEERYQATIHEYLDWTVTASPPESENEPDFSGFRVILLCARFRPLYPPPPEYLNQKFEYIQTQFGAQKPPIPEILIDSSIPIAAATIRSGKNFLEIPFFAISTGKRSKGFGRTLLEAIEDVAHGIGIKLLLLCSTEEAKPFWCHMGFQFTQEADWKVMGITKKDLLHMDNTVQMHKWLPQRKVWRSVVLRHGSYVQRLYFPER